MSSIAERAAPLGLGDEIARERGSVGVFEDFAAVEPLWRRFETTAIHTAYQRYDWVRAVHGALERGSRPLVVVAYDEAGAPGMVLPLCVSRRAGLSIAGFVGGAHANYGMALWRPAFAATVTGVRLAGMLREAALASEGRIDLFRFSRQPLEWNGVANPFASLPRRPSPSNAYFRRLSPDAQAILAAIHSKDTRKKLQRKEKALEAMGRLALVEPADAAETARFVDAFLAQKAARFAEMGVRDVFAVDGMREALITLIVPGAHGHARPVRLFALTLDERPIALFGGAAAGDRYSGMFNSIAGGAIARDSPGEILVARLVRRLCEEGYTIFDLGVGEARYKDRLCDGVDELFETTLAVTALGRAAAIGFDLATDAKRAIKRSPRLWRLVGLWRRARATR